MKNKVVLLVALMLMLGVTAFAQDYPKFEVPIGFSFVNVHPNQAGITSFNVFGGGGGFVYNFTPLIGIKSEFMGYTQGSGQKFYQDGEFVGNVSGNLFTYCSAPRLRSTPASFSPSERPCLAARIPTSMPTSAS